MKKLLVLIILLTPSLLTAQEYTGWRRVGPVQEGPYGPYPDDIPDQNPQPQPQPYGPCQPQWRPYIPLVPNFYFRHYIGPDGRVYRQRDFYWGL